MHQPCTEAAARGAFGDGVHANDHAVDSFALGGFDRHRDRIAAHEQGAHAAAARAHGRGGFFEAHIGCQLLPTSRFIELLEGAGFRDVGAIPVTPMHVVIHGTRR